MEQEVRKVAIWRVFISRWLPGWLNVSWRWSCRQLRGRAGPEAQGLVPGCSSSPLKEGQQSNESRSPPNLQLVLCQLYCISLQFPVFSRRLIHSLSTCTGFFGSRAVRNWEMNWEWLWFEFELRQQIGCRPEFGLKELELKLKQSAYTCMFLTCGRKPEYLKKKQHRPEGEVQSDRVLLNTMAWG